MKENAVILTLRMRKTGLTYFSEWQTRDDHTADGAILMPFKKRHLLTEKGFTMVIIESAKWSVHFKFWFLSQWAAPNSLRKDWYSAIRLIRDEPSSGGFCSWNVPKSSGRNFTLSAFTDRHLQAINFSQLVNFIVNEKLNAAELW